MKEKVFIKKRSKFDTVQFFKVLIFAVLQVFCKLTERKDRDKDT